MTPDRTARPDRRQVLAGLGALVASPTLRSRPQGGNQEIVGDERFPWGVASFDPTADGVLLWTGVDLGPATSPTELDWAVWADAGLTDRVTSGSATASAATGGCITVEVTGLPAGGIWWYRFELPDGATSTVGRTRTLPEGDVERIRIATASCSRFAAGGFAAYRAMADREVDLVVHLGDYIYDDGRSGVRPHDPPEPLVTLDQYRRRYAQHRRDPDLQALHARHPMVTVWDDHELAGNAWRDGAADHIDARDGSWDERRRAATQAHEEWLPGRHRTGAEGRLEVWRAVPIGRLAELLVLDTRSWRDRQAATSAELTGDPGRSLLGTDQRAWLEARLERPDRPPWVLLANQVMFHPLLVPIPTDDLAAEVEAAGFLVVDGRAVNPDQWDGYPDERELVRAAIGDRGGVVVLTGDVHSSWAWAGPAGDDGRPAMIELITPSITATSLGDRLPVSPSLLEAALPATAPDLSYVELTRHGYLVVDLGPDEVQAEWWYVDPADVATQAFGAARTAPRTVPMDLREVDGPRPDPVATTTSTTAPPPATTERAGRSTTDGGGLALTVAGGAVAVIAAGVGATLAIRRRR